MATNKRLLAQYRRAAANAHAGMRCRVNRVGACVTCALSAEGLDLYLDVECVLSPHMAVDMGEPKSEFVLRILMAGEVRSGNVVTRR